jgi:phage/plasmid-like protein (TIGR03299 family)
MSANLDMTNDRANIAFLGPRNDVWHRMGQEMKEGMSIAEWANAAGLNWTAIKVPAFADISSLALSDTQHTIEGKKFIVRSDNGHALGYVSDKYKLVQPAEILDWFDRYISVDDRFQLDVAGALGQGQIIWATATFREKLDVAGDAHLARVLMTTTYDGTGATINQGTMTRVVCNNTLDCAVADRRAVIKTKHNAYFDANKVSKELAAIAQGFEVYKAMGEAMAQHQMARDQIQSFFNNMLEIKADEEISTRKKNQLEKIEQAYDISVSEGPQRNRNSAWAALNAITRYVDHDRTANNENKAFVASQFGSGKLLKDKAVTNLKLLMAA